MKCPKCGNEIENAKFCPECGTPFDPQCTDDGWNKHKWFYILTLVLIPPIGIFMLWKNKPLPKTKRIFLTAVSIYIFIWLVFTNIPTKSQQEYDKVTSSLGSQVTSLLYENSELSKKLDNVEKEFKDYKEKMKPYEESATDAKTSAD